MKEDYLWDKSGAADPEIERLENALRAFRYTETDAPALPAKIVPFEKKTLGGFFRFAFPLAAFAALALTAVGVWFQISDGKVEVVRNLPERQIIAPPINEKASDEISIAPPFDSATAKVEIPKRIADQKTVKTRKTRKIVPAKTLLNNTIARNVSVKKPSAELTKDERYAYDQLMLALSITGSKLKIVEDKIYGADEPPAMLENERQIYQEKKL